MSASRLIGVALVASALGLAAAPLHGDDDGFFDDPSVVTFTVEAPLRQLFERGIQDESFSVPGRLSFRSARNADALDGDVSVRGNTSRNECPFPKLKVKLKGDAGPFKGMHSLNINTHCGDAPGEKLSRDFGRLANEKSPWREGVAYRIAEAAGARTPRVRPARITYVDTSSDAATEPVTRNALIVEDDDDVKQRFDADGQISPAEFTNARELFKPEDTAQIAFTQALIGNFDWCLMMTPDDEYRCDARKKLWNMTALRTADGAIPVMEDFDLSGPVTGPHVWFDHAFPRGFAATDIDTEVIAQVQRTRTLFDRALLDRTRRAFMTRRDAIVRAIEGATVDAHGAELARAYVDAFYRAIDDDREFYRPVVVREGVRIFNDAAGETDICGIGDTAPVGTPIKELRRENGRAEVQILDALWRWAPPHECVPVHKVAVWIDAQSIGKDFPVP